MGNSQHAVVAGAGIIGISCAIELIEKGFAVTVCDPEPPGSQTSFGNAAAFGVTEVVPIGGPDILWRIPGWLLDAHGPLSIRWRHLPALLPWLWRFHRASSLKEVERISRALRDLLNPTMPLTRAMLDKANLSHMITTRGALTVYQNVSGSIKNHFEWDTKQARGVTCEFVDAAKIRAMEPALENIGCGVFTPEWCNTTNPYRLTLGLAKHFTALGGTIYREQITSIKVQDQRAIGATTSSGKSIAVDSFFVCAGIWSKSLCDSIGEHVVIESERGYSTTLPDPGVELSRQIIFGDHKFVVTPIDEGLRVGGTTEFAGIEALPNYTRSERLVEIAMRYIPDLNTEGGTQWMGHRPSTPDSMPIISRSGRFSNVFHAFGHGHLGLTMAAVTAKLIGQLATHEYPSLNIDPFDIKRFN